MESRWQQHLSKVDRKLRERIRLLSDCETDTRLRAAVYKQASEDVVFFADYLLATFDPRTEAKILPFVTFDRQAEMLRWMTDCYEKKITHGCIKSRDTGISNIALTFALHKFMFEPRASIGLGSRKMELVDKRGNPDCLFEKLEMFLRWMPHWLKPAYIRKNGLFENLDNGATIKGEAGEKIGRGGRSSYFILDEAAFIERSDTVFSALSANSPCVFVLSTPNGTANKFYEMTSDGRIPVFKYRWEDDPRKTQEWFEGEVRRLGKPIAAQEYDCDFFASNQNQLIPSHHIQAAINAVGKIVGLREAGNRRQLGLDIATAEGKDRTILCDRQGPVVLDFLTWADIDSTQAATYAHQYAIERQPKTDIRLGVNYVCFDGDGVGDGTGGMFKRLGRLPYNIIKFRGGARPSTGVWSETGQTLQERFANRRAEAYGKLARRFRKTYEMVTGRADYPPDELISIPDRHELIVDLSKLEAQINESGKLIIKSKQKMRSEGLSSPDWADALAYAFFTENSGLDTWMDAI